MLTVKGKLTPSSPALVRPLVLQMRHGSAAWKTVARGKTNARGVYLFRTKAPGTPGVVNYRVAAKAHRATLKDKKVKLPALRSKSRSVAVVDDSTALPVPSKLVAFAGDSVVDLTWEPVPGDAAGGVVGYTVSVAPAPSGPWTPLTDRPVPTTSYAAAGLSNDTTYYFTVSSTDRRGRQSEKSAAVSATPREYTGGPTEHCGTLEHDETWQPGRVHTIRCSVVVPAGVTVTIHPGTVVKTYQGAVSVDGELVVDGSAGEPVVFTSISDDAVGGDTNLDASATQPAPGDWAGISLGQAPGAAVSLDHAVVKYASAALSTTVSTALSVKNSRFTKNQYVVWLGSGLHIDLRQLDQNNTAVENTMNNGVSASSPVWPDGTELFGRPDWTYTFGGTARVVNDTTVTAPAGTVVKTYQGAVSVDGELVVDGSAGEPVVFTSISDDAVGGDTNLDASATQPAPGDWAGISLGQAPGAAVSLDHAVVKYASAALSTTVSTALSVKNSRFTKNQYVVWLGSGLHIDLRQLDQNNTAVENTMNNGVSASSPVWPDGTELFGRPDWTYTFGGTARVVNDTTVTAPAGTVVKTYQGAVSVDGELVVDGSAGEPVVFTSISDDAVGGDTNLDASATQPAPGDWAGISLGRSGARLDADGLVVRYASQAVSVNGADVRLSDARIEHAQVGLHVSEGRAAFRGSINDTPSAIAACAWGSSLCAVDATRVDWGTPRGPFAADGTPVVCGSVAVNPWVGMGSGQKHSLYAVPNCNGSPTPADLSQQSQLAFSQNLARYDADCTQIEEACEHAERMRACISESIALAKAGSTFPIPQDGADWAAEGTSRGVEAITDYLVTSIEPAVSTIGMVVGTAAKIIGAGALITAINQAYNNCLS